MLYTRATHRETEQWATSRIVIQASLVLAIGLATGALTLLGQKHLPDSALQVANAWSVWLAASFAFGSLVRTSLWAIIGGAAVQALALAAWYITSYLVLDLTLDTWNDPLFWAIGGLLGGPVLGLAGYLWRNGSDPLAACASALFGATVIADGIYLLRTLRYDIGWAFVAVGLVAAIALPRSACGRTPSFLLAGAFGITLFLASRDGFGYFNDFTA